MKNGKDYIIFALDFASVHETEKYVNLLKGKVGMFKIGLELFIQSGPDIIRRVKDLSGAGIFLDLKFHDISETVKRVMERVAELEVDLVTVHCSSSQRMLEMAVKGSKYKDIQSIYYKETGEDNLTSGKNKDSEVIQNNGARVVPEYTGAGVNFEYAGTGVLGVTVLTDHDSSVIEASGFKDQYVNDIQALVIKRARMAYSAGCQGVVCSGQEVQLIKSTFGKNFLAVTPGIRPAWSIPQSNSENQQDDQKRITTPAMAIRSGADFIVVGRPIKKASDPVAAARKIADEIDACRENES
ncbi:MAG: orotidine 5'-phosphate decarboxylase [Desulfamplus sp.]|nr:orotidine 5'-phosphate decarboxylase [Desulfamplus sp.]